MSVEAMSLVLHHSRSTGTAKLVLLGIANHEGDGGAWPTIATLARYANVTERAVQVAIGKLRKSGELVVDRQAGGTHGYRNDLRPNLYRTQVACPWNCDRSVHHRLRDLPADRPMLELVDNGVKPRAPRNDRGAANVTPRGEATFTQTVTRTTDLTSATQPTTRARVCRTCNRPEHVCRRVAARLDDPHPFEAVGGER